MRAAGRSVRALTRHPPSANLPADVEVVAGDLSAPSTLDACLDGIDDVFLVWVARFSAAGAAIDRIASSARRVVLLSSPPTVAELTGTPAASFRQWAQDHAHDFPRSPLDMVADRPPKL